MKKWMLTAMLVVSMGLLGGCGGMKTVEIELKNMAFSQTEIPLKVGVPVKLVLVNKDTEIHDLSVDTIPITVGTEVAEDGHDHEHDKVLPDLHVSAEPGKKGAVIFTPTEEGTYNFYCTVPGHEAMGMKGTLIVSASGK